MVTVRLRFHSPIDRRGLPQDHPLELAEATSIERALVGLGYPERQVRTIVCLVNGEQRPRSQVLADGDLLEVLVAASGG